MNRGPLSRSGGVDVTILGTFRRPLSIRRLIPPLARWADFADWAFRHAPGGAALDPMRSGDPRVDQVFADVVADQHGSGVLAQRDAAFYTWRFLQSPHRRQLPWVIVSRGRAIGCAATQIATHRMLVIDLLTTAEQLAACLGAIVRAATTSLTVEMRMPVAHHLARRLWRSRFLCREVSKVLNVMLPEDSQKQAIYWDPTRWYVTWLDSDMDFLD
jgi:hypothetical protein